MLKKLTTEQIEAIHDNTSLTFTNMAWQQLLQKPSTQLAVDACFGKLAEDIWTIAKQSITVSKKTAMKTFEPPTKDSQVKHWEHVEVVLHKAIIAIPMAKQLKALPHKITRLSQHLPQEMLNNLDITNFVFDQSDPELTALRYTLHSLLKDARKHLEDAKAKAKKSFIQTRVEAIRTSRMDNPGKFFAKTKPDNVFYSQQMWAVDYEQKQINNNDNTTVTKITSSVPTVVAKKVKEAWQAMFTSNKTKPKGIHPVFASKKFQTCHTKIYQKDQSLLAPVKAEELCELIQNLSSGTAPGPDYIPNEMLKHCSAVPSFVNILVHLFNACIQQQQTPKTWHKANIYAIFKKGNPNDPLNYRLIALLCTTYKLYSSLINKRLSNFLENNHIFSHMQGGF